LVGRVTLVTGPPVADAVVLITGESPTHRDIAALTSDSGAYQFEELAPGRYTVMVNAEGHATHAKDAHVEAGKTARLDFTLEV
jgi:hypothetical protein